MNASKNIAFVGVEIFRISISNLKNGDYQRFPHIDIQFYPHSLLFNYDS
jgi:hypothetical protein